MKRLLVVSLTLLPVFCFGMKRGRSPKKELMNDVYAQLILRDQEVRLKSKINMKRERLDEEELIPHKRAKLEINDKSQSIVEIGDPEKTKNDVIEFVDLPLEMCDLIICNMLDCSKPLSSSLHEIIKDHHSTQLSIGTLCNTLIDKSHLPTSLPITKFTTGRTYNFWTEEGIKIEKAINVYPRLNSDYHKSKFQRQESFLEISTKKGRDVFRQGPSLSSNWCGSW